MLSTRALCLGYGKRTDNIDWAFNKYVNLGNNRVNDYGLTDALWFFYESFNGTIENRRKNQAKLFVSFGHVVHLLQDLHSPAHCRDNAHANGDYLEIYGHYMGGFRLVGKYFDSYNNGNIINAMRNKGSASSLLYNNNFYSYEDFFKKEVDWVSKNFFSEAHGMYADAAFGFKASYLMFDKVGHRDTSIFDGYNPLPAKSDVSESTAISGAMKNIGESNRWFYMKSLGNNSYVNGSIDYAHDVIGLVEKGYFGTWPTMMEVTKKGGNVTNYNDYNKRALQDTAINVMLRVVASTQAFINFFFRGQMEASMSKDGWITIKNISDPKLVSNTTLLTFRKGGKFYIFDRDRSTDKNLFTGEFTLSRDIGVNDSYSFDIKNKIQEYNIGKDTKITVVYNGDIGYSHGGYDSYGIGMKGLSVAMTKVPYSPYYVSYIWDQTSSHYVSETDDMATMHSYSVEYTSLLYGQVTYFYPYIWYHAALVSYPYLNDYIVKYYVHLASYHDLPFDNSYTPPTGTFGSYYQGKFRNNIPDELRYITQQTASIQAQGISSNKSNKDEDEDGNGDYKFVRENIHKIDNISKKPLLRKEREVIDMQEETESIDEGMTEEEQQEMQEILEEEQVGEE